MKAILQIACAASCAQTNLVKHLNVFGEESWSSGRLALGISGLASDKPYETKLRNSALLWRQPDEHSAHHIKPSCRPCGALVPGHRPIPVANRSKFASRRQLGWDMEHPIGWHDEPIPACYRERASGDVLDARPKQAHAYPLRNHPEQSVEWQPLRRSCRGEWSRVLLGKGQYHTAASIREQG